MTQGMLLEAIVVWNNFWPCVILEHTEAVHIGMASESLNF